MIGFFGSVTFKTSDKRICTFNNDSTLPYNPRQHYLLSNGRRLPCGRPGQTCIPFHFQKFETRVTVDEISFEVYERTGKMIPKVVVTYNGD